jgi:hypothetical protein
MSLPRYKTSSLRPRKRKLQRLLRKQAKSYMNKNKYDFNDFVGCICGLSLRGGRTASDHFDRVDTKRCAYRLFGNYVCEQPPEHFRIRRLYKNPPMVSVTTCLCLDHMYIDPISGEVSG